jgi:hypothetical protein
MSGPVLPGEPWVRPTTPAELGIRQGELWLRVGSRAEVLSLALDLPPGSPLREQLLAIAALVAG